MSTTTGDTATRYLTPEQVADRLPTGNADWVRAQLRTGKMRGAKIGGRWWAEESAITEMVEEHSNRPGRRRRRRSS